MNSKNLLYRIFTLSITTLLISLLSYASEHEAIDEDSSSCDELMYVQVGHATTIQNSGRELYLVIDRNDSVVLGIEGAYGEQDTNLTNLQDEYHRADLTSNQFQILELLLLKKIKYLLSQFTNVTDKSSIFKVAQHTSIRRPTLIRADSSTTIEFDESYKKPGGILSDLLKDPKVSAETKTRLFETFQAKLQSTTSWLEHILNKEGIELTTETDFFNETDYASIKFFLPTNLIDLEFNSIDSLVLKISPNNIYVDPDFEMYIVLSF